MPRPRNDDPRAVSLPVLGRAWLRIAERESTTDISLEQLAQELGVRRQSVWHHVHRGPDAFRAAIGEAVVERLTLPRTARGPWRKQALRLLRTVHDELAASPVLATWSAFALAFGGAWCRHLDALTTLLARSGAAEDRVASTAHACLLLARSLAAAHAEGTGLNGSDLSHMPDWMLFSLHHRRAHLASAGTFESLVGALLDALDAPPPVAARRARRAG